MGRKKKLVRLACIVLFSLGCFPQDVPELLKGVWKNSGRYVSFDTGFGTEHSAVPQIVLRAFYGWYGDRAAESASYSEKNPRDRNNTTAQSPAQEISIRYVPLTAELFPEGSGTGAELADGTVLYAQEIPSGAWNLEITFPGHREPYTVPVAVIGGSLYLSFALRQADSGFVLFSPDVPQAGQPELGGFWQDPGSSSGILISPPVQNEELLSYYVTDSAVYKIRYWQTDMDFDRERKAVFSDGSETHSVPAHLKVAGKTFTCVTGRRSRIRNIQKAAALPQPYTLNGVIAKKEESDGNGTMSERTAEAATICAFGDPYLQLVPGKTMEEILAEDAQKERPSPVPLFLPRGVLEFDWSIVEDPPDDYSRRVLDLGK